MARGVALLVLLCAMSAACAPLGDARCDEPAGGCNTPASGDALTLRTLRARMPRLPEGSPVNVRAVTVTGIDAYDETQTGRLGTIWAQEISPPGDTSDRFAPCPLLPDRSGRVCAISMFQPTFSPTGYRPTEGDLVDLKGGSYNEFVCATCGTPFSNGDFLPQVSASVMVRAGVAPRATPITVTLDEILAHYRELMGVLVTVENVTANTDPDARFGEMTIAGTGRNGLSLAPQLTPINGARAGTHWDRITGIVTYFYNPKLLPRSAADLVAQR